MKTPVNTKSFSERLDKHLFEKGESNEELFKSLNVIAGFLEITSVKQYAKLKGVSVQSVYQNHKDKIISLFGNKVIFDNY